MHNFVTEYGFSVFITLSVTVLFLFGLAWMLREAKRTAIATMTFGLAFAVLFTWVQLFIPASDTDDFGSTVVRILSWVFALASLVFMGIGVARHIMNLVREVRKAPSQPEEEAE